MMRAASRVMAGVAVLLCAGALVVGSATRRADRGATTVQAGRWEAHARRAASAVPAAPSPPVGHRVVAAAEHAREGASANAITVGRLEVDSAAGLFAVKGDGRAVDVLRWMRRLEQHAAENHGSIGEVALTGGEPGRLSAVASFTYHVPDAAPEPLAVAPRGEVPGTAVAGEDAIRVLAERWSRAGSAPDTPTTAIQSSARTAPGHESVGTRDAHVDAEPEWEAWRKAGEITIGDRVSEVLVRATSVRLRPREVEHKEVEQP